MSEEINVEASVESEPVVHYATSPTKAEGIVIASFFAAILGGIAWLMKSEYDADKRRAQEEKLWRQEKEEKRREVNAWENEQRAKGRVLYSLRDGRYLAVDATAPQETILRD